MTIVRKSFGPSFLPTERAVFPARNRIRAPINPTPINETFLGSVSWRARARKPISIHEIYSSKSSIYLHGLQVFHLYLRQGLFPRAGVFLRMPSDSLENIGLEKVYIHMKSSRCMASPLGTRRLTGIPTGELTPKLGRLAVWLSLVTSSLK